MTTPPNRSRSGGSSGSFDADIRELVLLLPQVLQPLRAVGGVQMPPELKDLFLNTPLGLRHIPALAYLQTDGPTSVSDLANHLGVRLATASQMVGDLDRAGLVRRREDEHDRRRTIVEIAPRARADIQKWLQSRRGPMERALQQLTPAERHALLKALRLLADELGSKHDARQATAGD